MEASTEDPLPSLLLFLSTDLPGAWFYIINGLVILLLILLSGLISGSEVAYFSLTREEIEKCLTSQNKTEKLMGELLSNPKRLLATILITNNLVNVGIVTVSTFLTWEIIGSTSTEGKIVTLLTFISTFIIVFFGEVIPKIYANQKGFSFAKGTARMLSIFEVIFLPLSWLLTSVDMFLDKRIKRKGYDISVENIQKAIDLTTETEGTEEEKDLLKGIAKFGTLTVKQVMKSRMDITAFDIEDDFHELLDRINKSGYSRVPVYRDTIDKIEGILYVKDLIPFIDENEEFRWQNLLRPGFFIPENKKVESLLRDFQEKKVHMAIVVDEYGGTSGLITLEDVIEEIVGEINDEFDLDDDEIPYNKLDQNTFVFEGKTSLNDVCKIIGEENGRFDEVKGESESLGGLILELSSKLPRVGEKIKYENFLFTIVAVDARRIKRVRVFRAAGSNQLTNT
ncbi:gliding motility-associated protein GldE [Marinigracilibium pacificum]|uniref:Gliding motility-associated protein GldE n=1 Tax=Marinigracilibium pacificum TaxID=2729599 RepID=A0A848IRI5_9BACT|nr:gliding motility-associated protein GldE [Marinigracilibium pacificum]NMM47083.1 gliding motility-associated protein GldE [Marinigracilibium pacificum]